MSDSAFGVELVSKADHDKDCDCAKCSSDGKKWTKKSDEAWDAKKGIKQGSKKDQKLDKERGVSKADYTRPKNAARDAARGAAGGAVGAGMAGAAIEASSGSPRTAYSTVKRKHAPQSAHRLSEKIGRAKLRGKDAATLGATLAVAGGVGGAIGGLAAKRKAVSKSAFGVEGGVSKFAVPFTPKARRQKAGDRALVATLSRREAVASAVGGPVYTAAKAPKGKKLAAVKTQAKYAAARPQSGGRATAAGYAHAKRVHGFDDSGVSKSAFGVEL